MHLMYFTEQPMAAYDKALKNARLETVAACGHYVDMEKPDELARLVSTFVNAN